MEWPVLKPSGFQKLVLTWDVHVHVDAEAASTYLSKLFRLRVYMLMLRLSNPVYQGRDTICLVQTLKIRPAQLSCLGGSAGRASA